MIDLIFFKVWRNNFLRKIIFHHLKLYNYINGYLNKFNSIETTIEFIKNFEPKGYLTSITFNIYDILNGNGIYDDHSEEFADGLEWSKFLPNDVTTLTIKYTRDTISLRLDEPRIQLQLPPLPDHITTLNIFTTQSEYYQNITINPLDISEWPLAPNYLLGKQNLKKLHFKKIPYVDYKNIDPLYTNSLKKTTTITIGQIPMGVVDLSLPDNFNGNLEIGCIPTTILKLKFGRAYDKPLKSSDLPNGLIELIYHGNHSIPLNCLPDTLEYLKLGKYFNSPILVGSLPKSLKVLKFGKSFNQPLKEIGCFPFDENLEIISLGKNWDNVISAGVLPSSTLVHLNLGKAKDFTLKQSYFSMTINLFSKFYSDELLIQCCNLKSLIITDFDKQILPNSLPNSIESIIFKKFNNGNKPIQPFSLPTELKYIDFGNKFNQKILPNSLPCKKLKSIIFGKSFNQSLENGLIPKTVEFITFENCRFNKSPVIIENRNATIKLKVRMYSTSDLNTDFKNSLNSIDLNFLSREDELKLNSTTFPNSLTSLIIRDEFRKPINFNGFLKDKINLTNLDICEPISTLELPSKENKDTNTIIIENIKSLSLYGCSVKKDKYIFPSVEILNVKDSNLIINENQFPNLKEIHSKNQRFISSIFDHPNLFKILKFPNKNNKKELDQRMSNILF
ncbi:hypothetical protein RB653_003849 [Dictyostelium firmibasis]|uniref:FNIP repeat-containing protein n=1 Tax=Dictyostelium firmibasis TaxID=79012 RepID=A0AAN7U6F0_9MYCE